VQSESSKTRLGTGYATDFYFPRREIYKEKNNEPRQSRRGPHLDSEEISCNNLIPMPIKEFLPRRPATSFGCWFDTVSLQDICDCCAGHDVAQIGQSTLNIQLPAVPAG